jgi:hypothetical protein
LAKSGDKFLKYSPLAWRKQKSDYSYITLVVLGIFIKTKKTLGKDLTDWKFVVSLYNKTGVTPRTFFIKPIYPPKVNWYRMGGLASLDNPGNGTKGDKRV